MRIDLSDGVQISGDAEELEEFAEHILALLEGEDPGPAFMLTDEGVEDVKIILVEGPP